jgi:mannose-6-phosphate isomerase-like protein (cupin superfamily)
VSGEGAKIPTAYVPAGGDRFRRQREIQFIRSVTDIKVSTLDTDGGLSVAEITYVHKGGPPRHLHHEQDEWFYVVEGEYVIEVGEERYELEARGIRSSRRGRWRTSGPMSERGQED